nr:MAG TPA: hypothetical protein [Caudoviricetes sp.]
MQDCKEIINLLSTSWFIAGLNHKLNQSIKELQKKLIINDYYAINIKV